MINFYFFFAELKLIAI